MDRNDFILAVALQFVLIGVAIAAMTDKGNAAEWAAAVFAGVAIITAVWTSGRALRQEEDRRKSLALLSAHKIAPFVIAIKNRIDRAQKYVQETDGGLNDVASNQFMARTGEFLIFEADIPDNAFTDAWALPAEVAGHCVALQAYIRQYHEYADTYRNKVLMQPVNEIGDKRDALNVSIENVVDLTVKSLNGLSAILNH